MKNYTQKELMEICKIAVIMSNNVMDLLLRKAPSYEAVAEDIAKWAEDFYELNKDKTDEDWDALSSMGIESLSKYKQKLIMTMWEDFICDYAFLKMEAAGWEG